MKKSTFLNYYMEILEKVSFSDQLLIKEYLKAKKLLNNDDAESLDQWIYNHTALSCKLGPIMDTLQLEH